jgi:molecular chaperone GrpE
MSMTENQDNTPATDQPAAAPNSEAAVEGAPETAPPPELPPPTPEERVTLLEAEKTELRDRMLRIAADFDNWKKRARKELADVEARSKEQVLRDFLEVVDNLERATASWTDGKEADPKAIRDGVDLVLRQSRSKLERYQVKPIESKGTPFDPRIHEAISQAPTPDAKPGSILHELQKGYLIGDRLLRPAMVVVAIAPPSSTPAESRKEGPAQDSANPSDNSKRED